MGNYRPVGPPKELELVVKANIFVNGILLQLTWSARSRFHVFFHSQTSKDAWCPLITYHLTGGMERSLR